jgi:hypothetical protein
VGLARTIALTSAGGARWAADREGGGPAAGARSSPTRAAPCPEAGGVSARNADVGVSAAEERAGGGSTGGGREASVRAAQPKAGRRARRPLHPNGASLVAARAPVVPVRRSPEESRHRLGAGGSTQPEPPARPRPALVGEAPFGPGRPDAFRERPTGRSHRTSTGRHRQSARQEREANPHEPISDRGTANVSGRAPFRPPVRPRPSTKVRWARPRHPHVWLLTFPGEAARRRGRRRPDDGRPARHLPRSSSPATPPSGRNAGLPAQGSRHLAELDLGRGPRTRPRLCGGAPGARRRRGHQGRGGRANRPRLYWAMAAVQWLRAIRSRSIPTRSRTRWPMCSTTPR